AVLPGRRMDLAPLATIGNQIRTLNLRAAGVTDADLRTLSDFPHLTLLRIEANPITDSGLKSLASLPELDVLVLPAPRVPRAGLTVLANLPRLKRVYAWGAAAGESSYSLGRGGRPVSVILSPPAAKPGNTAPTSPAQMEAMAKLLEASNA